MPQNAADARVPDENQKKRISRKFTKGPRLRRPSSVHYPDRLRVGEDVQDDVTAAKGRIPQYMNQSVFSMIAAAGSRSDFHARFVDESSDSDGEQEDRSKDNTIKGIEFGQQSQEHGNGRMGDLVKRRSSGWRNKGTSENKLAKALPKLNIRTFKEKNYMSQSIILPSGEDTSRKGGSRHLTPRDAPVMSRMLEAQAQLSSSTSSKDEGRVSSVTFGKQEECQSSANLATRLMEIFGFEKPEEVISGIKNKYWLGMSYTEERAEYPCWLLQSVLLQGYMYITDKHICFYAYLAKKSVCSGIIYIDK